MYVVIKKGDIIHTDTTEAHAHNWACQNLEGAWEVFSQEEWLWALKHGNEETKRTSLLSNIARNTINPQSQINFMKRPAINRRRRNRWY